MTGGRAYLYDPDGRHLAALDTRSVAGTRLAAAMAEREDGESLAAEFFGLLAAHRDAGSALAERQLANGPALASDVWLVEPRSTAVAAAPGTTDRAVPVMNVAAEPSPSVRA
jgi:glutamate synthase domain-containing protein 3